MTGGRSLSRVIMDLAEGDSPRPFRYDTGQSLETYLEKSYWKTASLMANSAKAAGVLSNLERDQLNQLHSFGRQLGLAFQIVDDILDFTGSDDQLGKPAASDLASGTLTAPVIYAMEEHPSLAVLIEREFSEPDDSNKFLVAKQGNPAGKGSGSRWPVNPPPTSRSCSPALPAMLY